MKKSPITAAALVLAAIFFLAGAFFATHAHAVAASLSGSRGHVPQVPSHKNVPRAPFSGIVEGTVAAISTTTIAIDTHTYRGSTATSTEESFVIETGVRIHTDQVAHATSSISNISSISAISTGSSVSLVIEHAGKDAGEVSEITVLPAVKAHII